MQHKAQEDWKRIRAAFKLRLANEQFEQGYVLEAVATLQRAASIDPTNPVYFRMLAQCHLETSSLEAARDAIRHAKSLDDDSPELAFLEGILAERHWHHKEALRYYQKAAEIEPENVDYLLAVGECLVNSGRPTEARQFLDEHLQGAEGMEQLAILRAQVHLLLDAPELAVKDFKSAEGLLADAAGMSEEFGLLLVRIGRYAEALAVLQPLVESAARRRDKDPSTPRASRAAVRALAICCNRLGTSEKAARLMEDHVTQSPDDGRAWWILAESQIRLADWEGAERSIRRGEQAAPKEPDWNLLRAYSAWYHGDLEQAAGFLETMLAERPDDSLALSFFQQVNEKRSARGSALLTDDLPPT
ncbi:MAG: tetratricopeptide repeat protein [Planctomycetes bacterium]|nr:tetratricopeptide repeat protein [Planctomycetota bacterium]